MQLAIADNGSGLPTSRNPNGGIGTHIMQHRAQILGGTFSLNNQTTGGALAMLTYPLSK
jgi:nitrate/nitrite-specific signal transduction histidine kinase